MMLELREWYRGRRVFVTGHTGFKGAWLVAWLRDAGASVTGYALPPETARPALFTAAGISDGIDSILADIRDRAQLQASLIAAAPELVFHLAAQSLVRRSYREPVETYEINVLGTAYLLDAARHVPAVRAIVVVTSDKCYEERGAGHRHHEGDPMGGHDIYSSSKGCAELVTAAFRRSFLRERGVAVASARAGNVIGGGDWAEDRLVPDLMAAAARGAATPLRHPEAVRPWQFVLEPLRGYLMLGRALAEQGDAVAEAWNFGPLEADAVTVGDLVRRMRRTWDRVSAGGGVDEASLREADFLALNCAKARDRLGWEPVLTLDAGVQMTVAWYRAYYSDPPSAGALVRRQLHEYEGRVGDAGNQR